MGVWVWGSGCGGLGVGVWVWGSGCGGLGTVTWKCLYLSVVVVLPSSFMSFSGRNSLTKYNLLQHVYHIWCALGTTSETFLTQGKVCFGWLCVAIWFISPQCLLQWHRLQWRVWCTLREEIPNAHTCTRPTVVRTRGGMREKS